MPRYLSALRAFLQYDSLPVAGIVVAFMLGNTALLGLPVDGPLLLLAACGVFLVYQFDRLWSRSPEDDFNQPARRKWLQARRRRQWAFAALAGILMVVLLPSVRGETRLWGGGVAVVSGLYVLPLLPGARRLKTVWMLKPVLIAVAWVVVGVVLPAVEAGLPLTQAVGWLVAYRLCLVFPNVLLADWPDRLGDRAAGLRTVATESSKEAIRLTATGLVALGLIGVVVAVGFCGASPLLWIDAVGLLGLLLTAWGGFGTSRWASGTVLDAWVAWPAVTALAAVFFA